MTFTKYGVVVDVGSGSDPDTADCYFSSVIHRNGLFWLYYGGYDGLNYRICLAISSDGFTFTKYGVVIDLGAGGSYDDMHTQQPRVIYRNGLFWMYYSCHDGSRSRICLAISSDGFTFTKYGIVIDRLTTGGIETSSVLAPSPIYRNGLFWLYYSAWNGTNYRICLALSSDGFTFTRYGVVIDLGSGSDSDNTHTHTPCAILRNGLFWLYYAGNDGTYYRVCLAISSDGFTFTKYGVVIDKGGTGEYDRTRGIAPYALNIDGKMYVYYTGSDSINQRIGLAISSDGF